MTKVHTFDSSKEAYDASQTQDEIHDGDLLFVPSEQLAGVLVGAWPVAVTEQRGEFHRLAEGITWETFEDGRYLKSAQMANAMGEQNG